MKFLVCFFRCWKRMGGNEIHLIWPLRPWPLISSHNQYYIFWRMLRWGSIPNAVEIKGVKRVWVWFSFFGLCDPDLDLPTLYLVCRYIWPILCKIHPQMSKHVTIVDWWWRHSFYELWHWPLACFVEDGHENDQNSCPNDLVLDCRVWPWPASARVTSLSDRPSPKTCIILSVAAILDLCKWGQKTVDTAF